MSKRRENNLRVPSLLVQIQTGLSFNSAWKISQACGFCSCETPVRCTVFPRTKNSLTKKQFLPADVKESHHYHQRQWLSWQTCKRCAFHRVGIGGTHAASIAVQYTVQNNWQLPAEHPKTTVSEFSGPSASATPLGIDRFDFSKSVLLCHKNKLGERYIAKEFAIQTWCM